MSFWWNIKQVLHKVDPEVKRILAILDDTYDPYVGLEQPEIKTFNSKNAQDIWRHGEQAKTYRAMHYSNPLTMESQGIHVNWRYMKPDYQGAVTLVHEKTHFVQSQQQRKLAKKQGRLPFSHYTMKPSAGVGYHFSMEAQGSGVEDHKIVIDYIDGKVTHQDLSEMLYDDTAGNHLQQFVSVYAGVETKYMSETEAVLKKLAADRVIRPFEDVFPDFMYALSKDEGFKRSVARQATLLPWTTLYGHHQNHTAQDIKEGLKIPKKERLFSREFEFQDAKDIICRDGRDMFAAMPEEKQKEMWQNALDIKPFRREQLEALEKTVKQRGLDV